MACPTFHQRVVDLVFQAHIKAYYLIAQPTQTPENSLLNYEEWHVLRYVAGYVPRVLQKKLEWSSHKYKEMILCLMEMVEEEESATDDSAEWCKAGDRSGPYDINQATYFLFIAMEEDVRRHQKCHGVHNTDGIKDKLTRSSIVTNEEVLFHCKRVCTCRALLAVVVNLWVTMREFAVHWWISTNKLARNLFKNLRNSGEKCRVELM